MLHLNLNLTSFKEKLPEINKLIVFSAINKVRGKIKGSIGVGVFQNIDSMKMYYAELVERTGINLDHEGLKGFILSVPNGTIQHAIELNKKIDLYWCYYFDLKFELIES